MLDNGDRITAFVPVKGQSKRLVGKNLLPLGGEPLLLRKIRQLKKVKELDEIVVSSDSEAMLAVAQAEGVKVVSRPKDLADETREFSDFVAYVCGLVKTRHLLWACCTSPFMTENSYRNALEHYLAALSDGYDSLITTITFQHFLLDSDGPLNFSRAEGHKNSEDLPRWELFTNGAIVCPVESARTWRYHFGPKARRYSVSQLEALDIDTEFDYEVCRGLIRGMANNVSRPG